MGRFVNPDNSEFRVTLNSKIYVDKTELLEYTNSVLDTMDAYICKGRGDFMKTLQEALKTDESIDTEFKSWIKASNMRERISLAVDELIAFVNCKGGTVYLGVEDNGEVTVCTGKYDLQSIQEAIYDKTSPHLFTEIEEIEYDGKIVIAISVERDGKTYTTANGRS